MEKTDSIGLNYGLYATLKIDVMSRALYVSWDIFEWWTLILSMNRAIGSFGNLERS